MKRLIKQNPAQIETTTADEPDEKPNEKKNKKDFTFTDLVDIMLQIEELKDYNVAIRSDKGVLQLAVGDTVYEVSPVQENRYPRRRLRKLET